MIATLLLKSSSYITTNKPLAHAFGLAGAVIIGELLSLHDLNTENGKADAQGFFPIPFAQLQRATSVARHTQDKVLDLLVKSHIILVKKSGANNKRMAALHPDIEANLGKIIKAHEHLTKKPSKKKKVEKQEPQREKEEPKAQPKKQNETYLLYEVWAAQHAEFFPGMPVPEFRTMKPRDRVAFKLIGRSLGGRLEQKGHTVSVESKTGMLAHILANMSEFEKANFYDPSTINSKLDQLIRATITRNGKQVAAFKRSEGDKRTVRAAQQSGLF